MAKVPMIHAAVSLRTSEPSIFDAGPDPANDDHWADGTPDLAILDVQLGDHEDGFILERWLSAHSSRVGIIVLTSANGTKDRVVELEPGVDDDITQPFEPRELLAQVRAALR